MATTSSLQNINWLNKKVWAVYKKKKNFYCPSIYTFPYNAFLYFLEGQLHRDSKLGIMTNVGKNRLVKVIFTNINKISDSCANSFGRLLHNVWEMFLLFIKFKFLRKNGFSEKIKAHLPQHLLAPLFNFIQKIVSPIPI